MGFGAFTVIFFVLFFLTAGVILAALIRSIGQWSKNNHSPRLTVEATVVAKRMDISHHSGNAGAAPCSFTDTDYYATFQVESGDRFELSLPGREYGLLVEGDRGALSFQGTRFLAFVRK